MSLFSSLHFFSFIAYLCLGLYILIKNPKPLVKRLCAAFIACLAIWSFANIFIHTPYVSGKVAVIFTNIGSFGWISFSSFFLWFMLVFSGKIVKKNKYLYPVLFALPIILSAAQWGGYLLENYTREAYGWRSSWVKSGWTYIFFSYYISFMAAGLFLVFDVIRKTGDRIKRKQAKIIFAGTVISLAAGTLSDVLLPALDIYLVPKIGNVFGLIWASGLVYAMARHRFLDIVPATPFNNIITTMFDCLVLLTAEGHIDSVNDAALDLLGYKEEELKGRSVSVLFKKDAAAAENGIVERIVSHENLKNLDLVFLPKKGKEIPVTFSSSFLLGEGGQVERIVCVARDITSFKRNEAVKDVLLNISEAARRAVTLRELLAIIQQQVGKLMDAKNFYAALVYDKEHALYTFPFIIDVNPEELENPDTIVELRNSFTDYVLRTEKPLLADEKKYDDLLSREEIYLIGKKPVSWMGVPLKTPEDEVIGVVVVQSYKNESAYSESDMDVLSIISNTIAGAIKYKQAEEALRKSEDKLARYEKMEAIGRLAGGVAHDLNNVLSAIVGYPDLLLMKLPDDSPLKESIKKIKQSGQKAAAIVQDLLTLARRGVAVKETENLNQIVAVYIDSPEFEKLAKYHSHVRVTTQLEENLPNIKGSAIHLAKTIMNLVSNAAEAIQAGGEISIGTKNQAIDRPIVGYYHTIERGNYVVLTVSDTGTGIAPGDLDKIFEPFYTKKEMGRSGTGLGMAVVWGTMEDHKGFIDVESTEGKGTTFQLYFPVTNEADSNPEVEVPIKEYMGKGEKILVVDDDFEQRLIATDLLRELGYSVHAVSSGEEAIDYMSTASADLLLLDMLMDPGIDGLDTYMEIIKQRPGTKAIIVSGFSESNRVKKALGLGAGCYLKKPYTLKNIGLTVSRELARPRDNSDLDNRIL